MLNLAATSSAGRSRIGDLLHPAELVLPSERLRIHAVAFSSPGFWGFIGTLSPLEVIRKYLNDRHRRKLEDAAQEHHIRGLEIQNEALALKLFMEKIKALRELGFSEAEIRQMVIANGFGPLANLEKHQDSGLIGGAEFVRVEAMEPVPAVPVNPPAREPVAVPPPQRKKPSRRRKPRKYENLLLDDKGRSLI